MLIRGEDPLTVSLLGCRMRDYVAESPITLDNPRAIVMAEACVDLNQRPWRLRPEELGAFAAAGLAEQSLVTSQVPHEPERQRMVAVYRRD